MGKRTSPETSVSFVEAGRKKFRVGLNSSYSAPAPSASFVSVSTISTDQAEELLEDGVRFVDVRTVEEFEDGHVPGALNVPINLSGPGGSMVQNPDFLTVMEACFNKDEQLIVSCKAGGRSARAAQDLKSAGFSDVLDMEAGWEGKKTAFGEVIAGWSAEGREVEMQAEEAQTYEALKKQAGL